MKRNEEGAFAPVSGYLAQVIKDMPEMLAEMRGAKVMPKYTLIEYNPLLDSSDMGPEDWVKIAKDIERNYYDYDGFVVIMGTDTMAYCASALSFMLENLDKTVVITGSILSIAEVYNDARRNLIGSMIFATEYDLPEVCIFFNNLLLRGNRSKKMDSNGLAAFQSPNFPPIGLLEDIFMQTAVSRHQFSSLAALASGQSQSSGYVPFSAPQNLLLPHPKGRFRIHTTMDTRVLVIRLVPGFDDEGISAMINNCPSLKALILEVYGTGNAPNRKTRLLDNIKLATQKGILVVVTTQCPKGAVMLGQYALGKTLMDLGVVEAGDMTTEATATKLAYLFGKKLPLVQVQAAMRANLRGEMTVMPSKL